VELPGPTGERNVLRHEGRGTWVCIAPWNFPLAIFLGQVTAALVAGNTVVAKPAPQTPEIAAYAVGLAHSAGIPEDALVLAAGGPATGQALMEDVRISGVAFTGSTATAKRIARTLLEDDERPLVPLIAETGGINAMIVDSTALPEQVVAMSSLHLSARQARDVRRCGSCCCRKRSPIGRSRCSRARWTRSSSAIQRSAHGCRPGDRSGRVRPADVAPQRQAE
jgi:delta 1-pyrroline-5-carboxylate dehydrogenase